MRTEELTKIDHEVTIHGHTLQGTLDGIRDAREHGGVFYLEGEGFNICISRLLDSNPDKELLVVATPQNDSYRLEFLNSGCDVVYVKPEGKVPPQPDHIRFVIES